MIEAEASQRIQSQIRTAARVHHLRLAHHSQHLGVEVVPIRHLRSGQIGGLVGKVDSCSIRDLISDRGIDSYVVVITLVIVEIALIGVSELEQVISMEQAEVVAQQLVLFISKVLAGILRVDVVRNQSI